MAKIQEIEPESFIQKWAPYLVAGVLAGAVAFYLIQFHGELSSKQSTWGQFGDFVGGAVNPIIGFFTIWLLAVSLRQNHKALSQANQALTQAKLELGLTRVAIQQASDLQKATEDALKKQIEIASHTRDMNNAVALNNSFLTDNAEIDRYRSNVGGLPLEADASYVANVLRIDLLRKILYKEQERLVQVYGVEHS